MTKKEAFGSLPAGASWSSSFGNPGEGGYVEYYRTPDGRRFTIDNGPYNAFQPYDWTMREVAP